MPEPRIGRDKSGKLALLGREGVLPQCVDHVGMEPGMPPERLLLVDGEDHDQEEDGQGDGNRGADGARHARPREAVPRPPDQHEGGQVQERKQSHRAVGCQPGRAQELVFSARDRDREDDREE